MRKPNLDRRPILAHHTGSLGDTLASVPALRAIRASYPNSEIHLLFDVQGDTRATAADIIRPLGLADEYIPYRHTDKLTGQLTSYFRLWRQISPRTYSQVISLLPSNRPRLSLWRDRLFYAVAGILKSASFKFMKPPARQGLKEAQARLRRLASIGIPTPVPDTYHIEVQVETEKRIQHWLRVKRSRPERPLIAICPGAKTAACVWPLENFLRVGQELLAEDSEILLLGGLEHSHDAERLIRAWGSGIDGTGKFSVLETAAALKQCAFMIGVDTGTTHLAAAVGIRCIAIFSQRELSNRWEPMGDGHDVIRQPVTCQGCGLAVCNIPSHPCMTGTTPETVLERARRLIPTGKEETAPTPYKAVQTPLDHTAAP